MSETKNEKKAKTKKKKKARPWLMWLKLGLSAAVPLAIAIFTVVSYIQQNEISKQIRLQDQRIANETREKDLYIAEQHRNEDAYRANLTRLQDADLANLTRQKDIDLANEQREEDRRAQDREIEEDRRRADDLHYQTLYSTYIEDISNVLYKDQQTQTNQTVFSSPEKRMFYIRQKTLLTLRAIDSQRKSQVFIFLHENNLLSETSSSSPPISLEGADLRNITVVSSVTGRYVFNNLVFRSVDLTDATFENCLFNGTTDFTGSILTNATFLRAKFNGPVSASLIEALKVSFINCTFNNQTDFTKSILTNSTFLHSIFHGSFLGHLIKAMHVSFIHCLFEREMTFLNASMSQSSFVGSKFEPYAFALFDRVDADFVDFRGTFFSKARFQFVDLSYSNFVGASFGHVDFISETLLMNSVWSNVIVRPNFVVRFTNTNLSNAIFDHHGIPKQMKLDNVILPNSTWVIDSHRNLAKNGDAESNCVTFNGTVAEWKATKGSPSLHRHMQTNTSDSSNHSIFGKCSFSGSSTGMGYQIQQTIDISNYSLFIKSGELQSNLSAYFEISDDICKVHENNVNFGDQLIYRPHADSPTANATQWHQRSMKKTLPTKFQILQTLNVQFMINTHACLIDNIEMYFQQRSLER